jgi:hypothetical protein
MKPSFHLERSLKRVRGKLYGINDPVLQIDFARELPDHVDRLIEKYQIKRTEIAGPLPIPSTDKPSRRLGSPGDVLIGIPGEGTIRVKLARRHTATCPKCREKFSFTCNK